MYFVYVLRDNKGNLYKGMTNNLERRFKEHRLGKTVTTSKMDSLELVFFEEYPDFLKARGREKYFKTAAGRRFLKKTLNMDG